MQPQDEKTLSYATADAKSLAAAPCQKSPLARVKSVLDRCPYWVIALVLAILGLMAQQCDFPPLRHTETFWLVASLFAPCVAKYRSWRVGLIAIGAGVLAYFLRAQLLDYSYGLSYQLWADAFSLAAVLGLAALAGVVGSPKGSLRASLLLCGWACAIALLAFGLRDFLSRMGAHITIPPALLCGSDFDFADELPFALAAIALWILIPAVLRRRPTKRLVIPLLTSLGIAGASLIAFAAYRYALLPYESWRSLEGHGPFKPQYCLWVAATDRSSGATERLWRALATADWDHDSVREWEDGGDWRESATDILVERDPQAPERLAQMLLATPHPKLAEYAGPILAKYKRYETAPILLRYALVDRNTADGVISMGVPQAAMAILVEAADDNALVGASPTPEFMPKDIDTLKALLHVDFGKDFNAWLDFCDQHDLSKITSPLPRSVAAEDDRVYKCICTYWIARLRLWDLQHKRAVALADAAGKRTDLESLWTLHLKYPYVALDHINPIATKEVKPFIEEARHDVNTAEPDWNVPTTGALEKEVQAYEVRITALSARS